MQVSELQNKLSSRAARDPEQRFANLQRLLWRPGWLKAAFERVAQNAGANTPGCDSVTAAQYRLRLEDNLTSLASALQEGHYKPQPCRRVYIPNGQKRRALDIPTLRDRVVQQALKMLLEPIFEPGFSESSFGYRSGRGVQGALAQTLRCTQGRRLWVIEGDIHACFDSLCHSTLDMLLRRRLADGRLLDTINLLLRADVLEDNRLVKRRKGASQGSILSPLLANVYLHELDRFIESGFAGDAPDAVGYVRYADDFVVLCRSPLQARWLRGALRGFLSSALRLELSQEKTIISHLNRGMIFLGFRLRRGGYWRKRLHVDIPKAAASGLLANLAALTAAKDPGEPEMTLFELNRTLGGWCRSYREADNAPRVLRKLDKPVAQLVVTWLAERHGLRPREAKRRFGRGKSFTVGDAQLSLPSEHLK